MSKHNYSQYSNKKKSNDSGIKVGITTDLPKITSETYTMGHPDPVGEPGTPGVTGVHEYKPSNVKMVVETVNTVSLPKVVEGVVANCAKLNVRAEPSMDAEVVCVLDAMSEIKINVAESTNEWFKICTAIGAEGYCMRKFVDAHL